MNTDAATEHAEARALARAITAALAGDAPPAHRPRDLDAVTRLLVAHAAAVRTIAPPPVVARTAPSPARFGLMCAAVTLLVGAIGIGAFILRLPPASSVRVTAVPVAGFTAIETPTPLATRVRSSAARCRCASPRRASSPRLLSRP